MGKALKKRMEMGFTFLKMDMGIILLMDVPGAVNTPLGVIEEYRHYQSFSYQRGSLPKEMMPGLGIESLNEELILENLHSDFLVAWASTDEWNNEWSNDRTWI